jgi:methylthioribose-1-phosphate isomerase
VSTGSQQGTAIEPLRFEDGALLILDQRALPDAERWIRCDTVEQVADCIRTLAVRGAPAIGLAAAYGMALANGRELDTAHGREPRVGAGAVPRRT